MITTTSILNFCLSCCFFIPFCSSAQSDTTRLKQTVIELTSSPIARSYDHVEELNQTAQFIFDELQKYADTVFYQSYKVNGISYKNVVAQFGIDSRPRIVIGAHYDVCGHQNGADDNASGVAGLLEIARNLKMNPAQNPIELVAYTLEEPPYFRTEAMGSYVHAKSLSDQNIAVKGMICLEMIGYFDDAKKSQTYPLGFLKLFYGSKGNYITAVTKFGSGKFARKFTKGMKRKASITTKHFAGPKRLTGIDFSDHLNYWKFGYSAVMLTDTAFYRNKNYHQSSDTIETLDFKRMAEVVNGVLLLL